MYELQPEKKSSGCIIKGLAIVGALTLGLFALLVVIVLANPSSADGSRASNPASSLESVHVRAESWNDGKVYLWHELVDGPDASYSLLPDGAYCAKLDSNPYKLGSGATAIYYYKLLCGGKVGYVQVDQVTR